MSHFQRSLFCTFTHRAAPCAISFRAFSAILTIEIESCFYTSGKHYCLFKLQLMICQWQTGVPEAGPCQRQASAPGTLHSKNKAEQSTKPETSYPTTSYQR